MGNKFYGQMEWLDDRLHQVTMLCIEEMGVRQLLSTLRHYREVHQTEDSTDREKRQSLYYINTIKAILRQLLLKDTVQEYTSGKVNGFSKIRKPKKEAMTENISES
tara:strand:- start:61570 stop:61887 length:318 start_codon:yes stop_codon:yes gene_type:complete